jgi:23S rRNA (guanine2445-N2)-methyltransferase
MDFARKNTVLITCARGLAPILQQELTDLGHTIVSSHGTGVLIESTLQDCMKLNLLLRTAYNVLYQVKELNCRTADDLYKQAAKIQWERIIDPDGYVCVVSRVNNPTITNSMFASLKLKDAIVDRISDKTGRRPDSGSERDRTVINLYWKDNTAWIYLNTSGRKIADRGYRRLPWKAPLQETLAAGIILTTGYDGARPLVLPMCGSGTLAVEAALIALNRAPGLLRSNFGFMHIQGFDNVEWKKIRAAIRSQRKKTIDAPIIATDISPQAADAAERNINTAGVDQFISVRVCDFAATSIPQGQGIVLLNPEYGERLGEEQQLAKTYTDIGDFFKQKCAGYTGYIFTGNTKLAKKVGLRTSRKIQFFNADIECRLLKYDLYSGTKKGGLESQPD